MPVELQIPKWEWWIVVYFFVGGIAGGAYFTAALIDLFGRSEDRPIARMGYYLAFPLSLVCGIALIADLGQPLRFWHMILYSKTGLPTPKWDSPISVGAYVLLLFGLFSFLSFVDVLIETGRLPGKSLHTRLAGAPRKVYSILGGLVGFFLASYTGVLLATTHLPVWSSNPLLGSLFLASAASTGMAAIAFGLALRRVDLAESWAKLRQADNVALILEIVLLLVFIILLGSTATLILTGVSGILLIGGTVIAGLIIPLVLQLRVKHAPSLMLIISALILIGGFLMRTVIVMGGQGLL